MISLLQEAQLLQRGICTIRKLAYCFLFTFHSNNGRIFSRFDTIHEVTNVTDTQPDRQTDTARQQRPRLCIASQKFDVRVCQVATDTIETTQLVLSQIKTFTVDIDKKRESRFLTAHQHKTGHSVPFEVKNKSKWDNQVK